MKANGHEEQFRIIPFTNPRTGGQSWRVTGWKRDRTRIRKNFDELAGAQAEKLALDTEWLTGHHATEVQATTLTPDQLRLCESALARLGNDADMLPAVEHWLKHGKAQSVQTTVRLDDAFDQFKTWLEVSGLRDLSRKNLSRRVNVFVNATANLLISDVTPETIEDFLSKRAGISAKSKDNDRRAVSRFFSWCIERPRRWIAMNPCREIKIPKGEAAPPSILTADECRKLLRAAQENRDGQLLPYVAVCLFAGLRPFEVSRLQWSAVNLKDREIRLEGTQTKTGDPRVIVICDTLAKWLEVCKNVPFFPANWRRGFDEIKAAAGYGGREWKTEAETEQGKQRAAEREKSESKAWPVDVMRHTAISHYFRKTGSYGQTAEQFGNSEAIIKRHYQGRVSSEDTKKFYALRPAKKAGAK